MYKIKFQKEIEKLIENRHKIPDEFWVLTQGGKYNAIWFMSRQKPSVEACYSFDEERFGLTKQGQVIWGFHSGCSCPSPWSAADFGDDYTTREWREFLVESEQSFDKGWEEECYSNLKDYLLLIKKSVKGKDVLETKNAEIRRFLMKRIGYEKVKKDVGATVIHTDGTSQLLQFKDGDYYVKVKDSSTKREYLLYVPNNLKTCRAAIAWTFGLAESEYNPIIET